MKMDLSAGFVGENSQEYTGTERRGSARFVSLIRAAKLIGADGEFICVIRDVSATGISLRTFHPLPAGTKFALELQNGETFVIEPTRRDGLDASFEFEQRVSVERLIRESWNYPKRQLRLNIAIGMSLSSLTAEGEATTINLSQQGARVSCDAAFALGQSIRVKSDSFPETRATVRWRKNGEYGLVFENTLTLRQFALLAAAVQCPKLLDGAPVAA